MIWPVETPRRLALDDRADERPQRWASRSGEAFLQRVVRREAHALLLQREPQLVAERPARAGPRPCAARRGSSGRPRASRRAGRSAPGARSSIRSVRWRAAPRDDHHRQHPADRAEDGTPSTSSTAEKIAADSASQIQQERAAERQRAGGSRRSSPDRRRTCPRRAARAGSRARRAQHALGQRCRPVLARPISGLIVLVSVRRSRLRPRSRTTRSGRSSRPCRRCGATPTRARTSMTPAAEQDDADDDDEESCARP